MRQFVVKTLRTIAVIGGLLVLYEQIQRAVPAFTAAETLWVEAILVIVLGIIYLVFDKGGPVERR